MIHDNIAIVRDVSEFGDIAKARNKFLSLEEKAKKNEDDGFELRYKQAALLHDFRMSHPSWQDFVKLCDGSGYSLPHLTRMSIWARKMTWEQAKKMHDDGVNMFAQMRLLESEKETGERLADTIERAGHQLEQHDAKIREKYQSTFSTLATALTGHWRQELLQLLVEINSQKDWKWGEGKKILCRLQKIIAGMMKSKEE